MIRLDIGALVSQTASVWCTERLTHITHSSIWKLMLRPILFSKSPPAHFAASSLDEYSWVGAARFRNGGGMFAGCKKLTRPLHIIIAYRPLISVVFQARIKQMLVCTDDLFSLCKFFLQRIIHLAVTFSGIPSPTAPAALTPSSFQVKRILDGAVRPPFRSAPDSPTCPTGFASFQDLHQLLRFPHAARYKDRSWVRLPYLYPKCLVNLTGFAPFSIHWTHCSGLVVLKNAGHAVSRDGLMPYMHPPWFLSRITRSARSKVECHRSRITSRELTVCLCPVLMVPCCNLASCRNPDLYILGGAVNIQCMRKDKSRRCSETKREINKLLYPLAWAAQNQFTASHFTPPSWSPSSLMTPLENISPARGRRGFGVET